MKWQRCTTATPGQSASVMNAVICRFALPFTTLDGVRAITTISSALVPLVHHSFSPAKIHACPSGLGTASVSIAAGSAPTPGSVSANAEIAPLARRGKYFFFWASEPNILSGCGTPIDWCAESSAVTEPPTDDTSSIAFIYDSCDRPSPPYSRGILMPNAPSARSPSITASGISPSRSILSESTWSRRNRSSCSRNGCARRTSSGSCSGYGSINAMRRRPRNRSRTKLGATQCCSRAASATSRASSALTLRGGVVTVVMAASQPNLSGLTAPGLGGDSPRLHRGDGHAHAARSDIDGGAHHAAAGASAEGRPRAGPGPHQSGTTHRRAFRRGAKQRRHRRRGRAHQGSRTARAGAGTGARRPGDRPLAVHRAPGLHRHAHPSAAPGRSHGGVVRPAALVPVDRVPRHPRGAQRAPRAGARLHGAARFGDRRRDVRRRGHQAGYQQRGDPGTAHLRVHARHGPDRDVPDRVVQLGARAAARRRARRRRGRRAPRGARAGGARRRLDQILLRSALLLYV